MISDVLRNAKLAPIILHGRKMMGTDPASCLNLPKHFGSLYLEPVFFPHGQKPASAVSVFKQAILRCPPPFTSTVHGARELASFASAQNIIIVASLSLVAFY